MVAENEDYHGDENGMSGRTGESKESYGNGSGCSETEGLGAGGDGGRVRDFNEFREAMNERILEGSNRQIRRFFNLDTRAYDKGALSRETKEMLGLVASLVLRCDECIKYHVQECCSLGISEEKIFEVFNIGLIVGGSIVIPHLREAVAFWDELKQD